MHNIKKVHMDFTLEMVDKVFYGWSHSLDSNTFELNSHFLNRENPDFLSSSSAINTKP